MPAFAIWKNHFKEGQRTTFPAVTSDHLPTILDILGINYPDERPVDGISMRQALTGTKSQRETPIGFICRPHISWVNHQYKLISHDMGEHYELYDLLNDKSEKNNIIEEHPDMADKMKAELSDWLLSVENSKNGNDYKTNE